MQILHELRHPTRRYTQIIVVILALALFAAVAGGAIAGLLTYRILKPQRTSTDISMQSFPGRPDALDFAVPGVGQREGWFFPGLRGAPTVVLCHGYQSSRGELLTLVSALQDHQYNVFVFDFAGHGSSAGATTFGYRETAELRAAIDTLAKRDDVDAQRFGVWGYNLGAYAAMAEAEKDQRVKALAVDSVYDAPAQMIKVEVEKTGLGRFPFMVGSAEFGFRSLYREYSVIPPLSKNIGQLAGVPKLFISALNDPELAATARELFVNAPEPREQAVLARGNFVSLDDDAKREYENRIVSFFLLRLPPSRRPAR